jgi:hypothetical protein
VFWRLCLTPRITVFSNLSIVWPPLWSSGQSSWIQIQRSGFDFRRYQIFWVVVGLERGPLSLVSTFEELLESNCSGSGLGNREYGRREPSRWPRSTLYLQKLALTSPISGGRSVGIVRSRTQATELVRRLIFYGIVIFISNSISCSIAGWGDMLQAGRSRVRLTMGVIEYFSVYLILPAAVWLRDLLSL